MRPSREYIRAHFKKGLEGYSHVQILWWMDGCDNVSDRETLVEEKPYRKGPDKIEHPVTPSWCAHWPKSYEESGDFN